MAIDSSKDRLIDDMGETLTDWSKKKIRERQAAHGATPSADDWSKKQMLIDGAGISPTTTTSSTTTTTTTNTASTSSSTTTSTSTSTATTVTPPPSVYIFPVADGPGPIPLQPLALNFAVTPPGGPGPAAPAPPGVHWDTIDDGTIDPPSEVDWMTAAFGHNPPGPETEQLVLGAPSTPGGVYTAALVTLRMNSVHIADMMEVAIWHSNGGSVITVVGGAVPPPGPGPGGDTIFQNTIPGTTENIQVLIPFTGPMTDAELTGAVLDLDYWPTGPNSPIEIYDVQIELV